MKNHQLNFEAFGPIHFRIHPSNFVSRHIINKYKGTCSTGSHTCPHHDTTSTLFTHEVACFGSWAVQFLLHTLSIILKQLTLCLICFCSRAIHIFFNQVFLFLRLTGDLYLVVNPLYFLWWRFLLIVNFYTDTPTSWRGFFIWPPVVNRFFFTAKRILPSSIAFVCIGLLGILVFLSSPVISFFEQMHQLAGLAKRKVFFCLYNGIVFIFFPA